jgi:hypothetical protein
LTTGETFGLFASPIGVLFISRQAALRSENVKGLKNGLLEKTFGQVLGNIGQGILKGEILLYC